MRPSQSQNSGPPGVVSGAGSRRCAVVVGDGAQQAAGTGQLAQQCPQQEGGGGLAVGAGDADGGQRPGRAAVQPRGPAATAAGACPRPPGAPGARAGPGRRPRRSPPRRGSRRPRPASTKSWPSAPVPRTATNRTPGPAARESAVTASMTTAASPCRATPGRPAASSCQGQGHTASMPDLHAPRGQHPARGLILAHGIARTVDGHLDAQAGRQAAHLAVALAREVGTHGRRGTRRGPGAPPPAAPRWRRAGSANPAAGICSATRPPALGAGHGQARRRQALGGRVRPRAAARPAPSPGRPAAPWRSRGCAGPARRSASRWSSGCPPARRRNRGTELWAA